MGLEEREAAREELEVALDEECEQSVLHPRVTEGIKRAEEAGLSYEEIVKILLSHLD